MSILSHLILKNKTALVTGCDTGLGQAMAIVLAEAGADIIGISNTEAIKGGDTEKAITALGRKYAGYEVDISCRKSVYSFVSEVKTSYSIDILINNAGMILPKTAAELHSDWWNKVITVNIDTLFVLAQEFGKEMIAKGNGKIVFTCSLVSFGGKINIPGYRASKSAVAGLVKVFAGECGSSGVNVNGISPGYPATDTETFQANPDRFKAMPDTIPVGDWAEIKDFKETVIFLASEVGVHVNGVILNVEGAWVSRQMNKTIKPGKMSFLSGGVMQAGMRSN